MRKTTLFLAALLLSVCAFAKGGFSVMQNGNTEITQHGDTVMIVENGDTTTICSQALGKIVNQVIGDSLSQNNTYYDLQTTKEDLAEIKDFLGPDFMSFFGWIKNVAFFAICIFFLPLILVPLLIFIYKWRSKKAKNRLIEKAIEAGYPLPDEFVTGRRTYRTQTQTQTQAAFQTPPPFQSQTQTKTQTQTQTKGQPQPQIFSAKSYTPAVHQIIVSLGIAVVFLYLDIPFLSCIAMIFAILGAWKAYTIYVDNKNLEYYIAQQQAAEQQSAYYQQQEPKQPSQPSPESEFQPKE